MNWYPHNPLIDCVSEGSNGQHPCHKIYAWWYQMYWEIVVGSCFAWNEL